MHAIIMISTQTWSTSLPWMITLTEVSKHFTPFCDLNLKADLDGWAYWTTYHTSITTCESLKACYIKTDVDAIQTCRISFVSLQPISPIPWSQTTSNQAPLVGSNTGWPCFLWSNGRSMTILAGIYYRPAEQVCIASTSLQLSISDWVPPLSPFHNVKAKYLRRYQIHDAAYTLYLLWNLHQDSDRGLCEAIKQGDKFLHNCSGR
jgi:hypothetical protein